MLRIVALSLLLVSSALAGSPGADLFKDFESLGLTNFARASNDIYEDADLSTPELITKYNYPLEVHEVVTSDGYILEVHRIPHGRDNNKSGVNKPVVFLMHGLLCSSASWVLLGPEVSLGYILAEAGYDVWMGNARGNTYSRKHITLDPDTDASFWDFSWHEIGAYDLSAIIDYALAVTGQKALHYIGHSQGTTTFFVLATTKPEYNAKIKSAQIYAAIGYRTVNERPTIDMVAPYYREFELLVKALGLNEWFPKSAMIKELGFKFCSNEALLQPICVLALGAFGATPAQLNATSLPIILAHTPAGSSARQFLHYVQSVAHKGFKQYDYGAIQNLLKYRSTTPPDYNLGNIVIPTYIYYHESDLTDVSDVILVYNEIGGQKDLIRVSTNTFGHFDFVWGKDAEKLLWQPTIDAMRRYD